IAIVAFVAVFLAGGILALVPQLEEQTLPLLPSVISPPNENVNKPDQLLDTSTWQTYHNEEFGFEFMYPAIWGDAQGSGESFTAYFQTPEYPYSMMINAHREKKSFMEYLDMVETARVGANKEDGLAKGDQLTVAGRSAVQHEIHDISGLVQIETFIDGTPKIIVQVYFMGHEGSTMESSRELNDQILGTFRFIE
ncbi:MAG: hypothetical protein AAB524_03025, partial [Patescibacteria group bacterium]